ncbi:AAWKG family protein [Streptomyces sp. NPDC057702]|uniref:AAWKG family protein n=1 Tax=unclassified Streptomyces TaxID=2593676 RepID=UPI003675A752
MADAPDHLTAANDSWQTAVKLFTGYDAPKRDTLFQNLTGNDGIPQMKVEVTKQKSVTYVDVDDLNWMVENAGWRIENTDFVIPFYTTGDGGGTGSQVSMYKARFTLLGNKSNDGPPAGGVVEGGEFKSQYEKHLGLSGDKATWTTEPLTQYAYGTGRALEALLYQKTGTHGFAWNGKDVSNDQAVSLASFDTAADAFDRVAQFFVNRKDELAEWQRRVGIEKNAAWRGQAAGVFWQLIHTLGKRYDGYAKDMRPKGTLRSRQGDEIRQAKTDFRDAVVTLHRHWMTWELEMGNPLRWLHDLLSRITDHVWQNNIRKITYKTNSSGVGAYTSYYTTYHTLEHFSEKAHELGKPHDYGPLKELSTWKAVGERAIVDWQRSVIDHLVKPADEALRIIGNSWGSQVFDLGTIRSRGDGDLAGANAKDEADVAKETADKAAADAAKANADFIKWQKEQAAAAAAAAAAAKAEAERKEREAKAEAERKEREAKAEAERKEREAKEEQARRDRQAKEEQARRDREQAEKEKQAKAEQEAKEKEQEAKQAEQEAKQEQKEKEQEAKQAAKEAEQEQKQAEHQAKQEAKQAEQEAKQEQQRQEQEAKQEQKEKEQEGKQREAEQKQEAERARQEQLQITQINQAKAEQERAKKEQEQKEKEQEAKQAAKEAEQERKQAEQQKEQERKQAEQEARQEQKEQEQEAKQEQKEKEVLQRQEELRGEQEAKQAEQEAKQEQKEKEALQRQEELRGEQEAKQAEQEAKQERKEQEQRAKQEEREQEAQQRQEESRAEQETRRKEVEETYRHEREGILNDDLSSLTPRTITGPVVPSDGPFAPDAGVSHVDSHGRVVTDYPDGTRTTIDPDTHTATVTRPDGTPVSGPLNSGDTLPNPDGSTSRLDPDGRVVTDYPDGSRSVLDPETGRTTYTHPDGTTSTGQLNPGGPDSRPGSGSSTPPYGAPSYEEELYDAAPYESPYDRALASASTGGGPDARTTDGGIPLNTGTLPGSGGGAPGGGAPMGGMPMGGMPMGGAGQGGGGQSASERVRNVIDGDRGLSRHARGGPGAPGSGRRYDEGGAGRPRTSTTGGTPYLPSAGPGGSGHPQTQSGDRARDAWVEEDEDVWGTDEGGAPAVIGR